ncbi:MAG: SHOCT domain-containing protein [Actinomycetota bacterium]
MTVLTMATEIAGRGDWGPGPWWPIFPIFWVLVLGVVIFALFRFRGRGRWQRGHSAEDVLAERYARGEISVDEYRERLSVLKEQR